MKITVRPDGANYCLWCEDGRMSASPAGSRLFRAPPLPDIKFEHSNMEEALKDAVRLTKYIDDTHHKNARDSRKHGA